MSAAHVTLSLASRTLDAVASEALRVGGIEPVAAELLPADGLHIADDDAVHHGIRRVVVVSSANRRQTAELLDSGAEGIVLAAALSDALVPTIRAVLAGQVVVPRGVRNAVRRPILSPREKQILGMVILGLTNQEIAGRLHLAPTTIKSHLGTMFAELGVRSRKEAADLILDPSAGLGPGILRITPEKPDVDG